MLARHINRQVYRPVRYNVHGPTTRPSVSAALQLLTRLGGLRPKMMEALNPDAFGTGGPSLRRHLDQRGVDDLVGMQHELMHTGDPGMLPVMLTMLHNDRGVPPPQMRAVPAAGGGTAYHAPASSMDDYLRVLHLLDHYQTRALVNPHSALRQYTPGFLSEAGREVLGDLPLPPRHVELGGHLHPDLGGTMANLPGLYDQAQGPDRSMYAHLMDLVHSHALQQARQGRLAAERRAAVMGG